MRWSLERCASLVNADAEPVTREFLISTETQTHLHPIWQCLTLREQRRHLPTQLGKGWSRRTHPASDREGVASTSTMYILLLQRAYFITRVSIGT